MLEKEKQFENFGYDSKFGCDVCGRVPARVVPKFGYSVCIEHMDTPPIKIQKIIENNAKWLIDYFNKEIFKLDK